MRIFTTPALAFLCLMAITSSARAQSVVPEVSGFGTLGLSHQAGDSSRGYVRSSTQPGTTSSTSALLDSRLGLQADWTLSHNLEASAQVVELKRPSDTPLVQHLERAYLGWKPGPDTRLRAGRINPDLFLYADSRNVGYSLMWARPPVDFYGFAPLAAIDGVDLEQLWRLGGGDWKLRVTAGSFRASVTDAAGDRVPLTGRNVAALALSRYKDGLLLKASYLQGRLSFDTGNQLVALRGAVDAIDRLGLPQIAAATSELRRDLWSEGQLRYFSLAAQYETGPWTWASEASVLQVPGSPLNSKRAYTTAGYRHKNFTYYITAGMARPNRASSQNIELAPSLTPVIGATAAQQAQMLANYSVEAANNYQYHQHTAGIGTRWDFSTNATLKVQWDHFSVARDGGAAIRNFTGATRGQIVTVLVDFVWGP